MNKQMTEVYSYYKEQYPKMAILFRVRDNFVAFFDDAEKVGDALQIPIDDPPTITIPADQILEYTEKLCHFGVLVKTISWRNNDGEYTIPDVARLKTDRDLDY